MLRPAAGSRQPFRRDRRNGVLAQAQPAFPTVYAKSVQWKRENAAAPMTVVETPFFLRKAPTLLDEEERSELVVFLGANPEAGDILPETGGVRKLRWAAPREGQARRRQGDLLFPQRDFPVVPLDRVCEKPESKSHECGAKRFQKAGSPACKNVPKADSHEKANYIQKGKPPPSAVSARKLSPV